MTVTDSIASAYRVAVVAPVMAS